MTRVVQRLHRPARRASGERGYSLLEVLVVLGVVAVLGGMAGLQIVEARPGLQSDGAMRVVLSQMRTARELSIAERRYIQVNFVGTSSVRLVREEVPGPTTTTLSTVGLESNVVFSLVSGLPDTPDAFGNSKAVSFGTVTTIKFTPDGTLVDQDGNAVNGTVFFAQAGAKRTARAITVLGSTGRIRAYRWDGRNWKLV